MAEVREGSKRPSGVERRQRPIILTDMPGGTPCNVVMPIAKDHPGVRGGQRSQSIHARDGI